MKNINPLVPELFYGLPLPCPIFGDTRHEWVKLQMFLIATFLPLYTPRISNSDN